MIITIKNCTNLNIDTQVINKALSNKNYKIINKQYYNSRKYFEEEKNHDVLILNNIDESFAEKAVESIQCAKLFNINMIIFYKSNFTNDLIDKNSDIVIQKFKNDLRIIKSNRSILFEVPFLNPSGLKEHLVEVFSN